VLILKVVGTGILQYFGMTVMLLLVYRTCHHWDHTVKKNT